MDSNSDCDEIILSSEDEYSTSESKSEYDTLNAARCWCPIDLQISRCYSCGKSLFNDCFERAATDLQQNGVNQRTTERPKYVIHDKNLEDEEDMPNLKLDHDASEWSKLISDIQLNSKLSQLQRELEELLCKYSNIFSNNPGCIDLVEHDIELESNRPIVAKPYRMSPRQVNVLKAGVMDQGFRQSVELIVEARKDFPTPTTKTQFRAFLSLAEYYRRYIPEFSLIAAALTDLLKGKIRKSVVDWNEACQKAFGELKVK
ncbi:Gag-Pol polyprotein like [Argiope bruennichi]|uniref:Gag-Pol polyprotein like n=1 Tax=Argiope bruennichi TaxID=94029 RepID=A0A8T0FGM3_ARGBR|nr:Gag-Pol polyprotein like [Argiope bruennichi]